MILFIGGPGEVVRGFWTPHPPYSEFSKQYQPDEKTRKKRERVILACAHVYNGKQFGFLFFFLNVLLNPHPLKKNYASALYFKRTCWGWGGTIAYVLRYIYHIWLRRYLDINVFHAPVPWISDIELCYAHWCSFPSFFWLIPRSTENILDSFLII